MTDFSAIYSEAKAAGLAAAIAKDNQLGPENSRGFDCGFAWAEIRPARGPFVAWMKANGISRAHWVSGRYLWSNECGSTLPTQSIEVHLAACRAFAAVLTGHGIKTTTGSRLD